jgi:hypothetical protein
MSVDFMPVNLICPHPHATPGLCGSVINRLHVARFAERRHTALEARARAYACARTFRRAGR